MTDAPEVLVVGGGAAGLSAAIVLGRSRRSVLVIDARAPRNAAADGVHTFLSRDGVPPAELLATGRTEAEGYGVRFVDGTAASARRTDTGFEVDLEDGTTLCAQRLVVATGLTDDLPDLPGVRENWGRGVVHCPYCHGWEVRDRRIAVLNTGPMTAHHALLFRQLSDTVAVFAADGPPLDDESRARLAGRGVSVVDGAVAAIEAEAGEVTGVRMADGRLVPAGAVAVAPRVVARSAVLDALGVARVPHPMGGELGEVYASGPGGDTTVPGLYLAGNVRDANAQVVVAAAQGMAVGALVNGELVMSEAG